jgi:hypothetical protein
MFLTMFTEGIIILLFSIFAIIGTLIGFALAPLYLWFYKKYIGRNHLFAIQDPETIEHSHGMSKGFFPALMATNFTLILIFEPSIMAMPWFQELYIPSEPASIAFVFFLFCSLLMLPSFALFSAAWTVDEAGLLSLNKYGTAELQAVGRWFLAFLKGYAGISALVALYQFTFYILHARFCTSRCAFLNSTLSGVLTYTEHSVGNSSSDSCRSDRRKEKESHPSLC